jgi:hypothetical protein
VGTADLELKTNAIVVEFVTVPVRPKSNVLETSAAYIEKPFKTGTTFTWPVVFSGDYRI